MRMSPRALSRSAAESCRRVKPPGLGRRGRTAWWSCPGMMFGRERQTSTTGTTSCCTSSPHQLDQQDGSADGTPILEHRSQYVTWARVLGDEYDQLRRDIEQGRTDVLDEYGATNPAEFFAVATECFFEKPIQLRRKHPQLYEELKAYYRQDPVSFVSS